jgi:hypothetical protein
MVMGNGVTERYKIAKEVFKTGICDASTHNTAMDTIDDLLATLGGGDPHWKTPVVNAAALPPLGNQPGDVRLTLDTFIMYVWNGVAWAPPAGSFPYETYSFGRAAAINNAYLRTVDGNPSNLTGYPMRKASTIVAFSVSVNIASICTVELYQNGIILPIDTLALNGLFNTKASGVAIAAGSNLACRINGGPAQRPIVSVLVI